MRFSATQKRLPSTPWACDIARSLEERGPSVFDEPHPLRVLDHFVWIAKTVNEFGAKPNSKLPLTFAFEVTGTTLVGSVRVFVSCGLAEVSTVTVPCGETPEIPSRTIFTFCA